MPKQGRSLVWKVTSLGLAVFAAIGTLQFIALNLSARIQFGEVEARISEDHAERLRTAVGTEMDSLVSLVRENASWDDMNELVLHGQGAALPGLLPDDWIDLSALDFICLQDLDREVLWIGAREDPKGRLERRLDPSSLSFFGRLPASGSALLPTRLGPILVAVLPVQNTAGNSSPSGYLAFGRLLSRAPLTHIAASVRLGVEIDGGKDLEGFKPMGEPGRAFYVRDRRGERSLLVPVELGQGGDPVTLGMRYPMSSGRAASRLLGWNALSLLAAALLALLASITLLRKVALIPILRIASHIDRAAAGEVDRPLALGKAAGRMDEVGVLADRVDQLIEAERSRALELAAANQELELRALTDALTGLPNRRSFGERLERERRRLLREKRGRCCDEISFVICDIDCFKRYNDRYGHAAGDACLRAVAEAIAGAIRRPTDMVCRQGGEEFLVMLPGTDASGGACVADNIRASVEALGLPHEDSSAGSVVTLSLGVASMVCDEAFDHEALFARADAALYEAKAGGRNRVVVSAG